MPGTLPSRWTGRSTPRFPSSERYQQLAVIARGGAGVVFRAYDRQLRHDVALKVLHTRGATAESELKSEFRTRMEVHHSNLVQLFDLVISDHAAFFTMELVDGPRFQAWAGEDATGRRLASAACQLARALGSLHMAGLVHNDVKPDNILVDVTGRVVLADFGLSGPERWVASGTPDYMAPERRRGVVSPQSDLYALGVSLYEAWNGAPALEPSLMERLPDALRPTIARLCETEASQRPSTVEVVAVLSELAGEVIAVPPLPRDVFIGRSVEIDALRRALARGKHDTAVIHIRGSSGIGKSALVREAIAGVDDLLLLRGRCHAHEHVAHGGLDQVVHELARRIASPLQAPVTELGVLGLSRLFPILRVEPEARSGGLPVPVGVDELRRAAIDALLAVLARVVETTPLVIWIDDLQWADTDTLEILRRIVERRIHGVSVILSYRDELSSDRLDGLRPRDGVDLALPPLSSSEFAALLRAAVPVPLAADTVAAWTKASEGFPIFARLLARSARDPNQIAALQIEDLLESALSDLTATERDVFDAVALSPAPVPITVALRASRAEQRALASLRSLEQRGLVNVLQGSGLDRIHPFHDRVRQLHVDAMTESRRSDLHASLADAHEELASGDVEALAQHYAASGRPEQASANAVVAGDRAVAALAFAAAAEHYARAIGWHPDRPSPWELLAKLGDCEANLGLGESAGRHFQDAADFQPLGSRARLDLRRRAAEQLLRSGHVREGYQILRQILQSTGKRLPTSHREALMMSVRERVRLLWRDMRPVARDPSPSRDAEAVSDLLWTASTSLAHLNFALADVLLLYHCHDALTSGDSSKVLRALTYEAAAEATVGGPLFRWRSERLLARASPLARTSSSDYDRGWYWSSRAAVAYFGARWRDVVHYAEVADDFFVRHGFGVAWERAVTSSYWTFALALRGRQDELSHRLDLALDDARARRDHLAEHQSRSGYAILRWLLRDDVARASHEIETARALRARHDGGAARSWPEDGFSTPDYHGLLAESHVALYAGEPDGALTRIRAVWGEIDRAALLRIQFVGADLRFLRARAALAVGASADAREQARALARNSSPVARPYAELVSGLLGKDSSSLLRAAEGFRQLDMPIHAAASRFRAGHVASALRDLRELGVANPPRTVQMVAPLTWGGAGAARG